MKIVAIIQARMGSTRLPGKILKKVMGKTLLEYQLERVRRAKQIDEIIIATTEKKEDDVIVQICNQNSIRCFRGSEENVLERYYKAGLKYHADLIVRLTSDCPLIDPFIIDRVITTYLQHNYDYVSNTIERTYPRGIDVEVFSMSILQEVYNEASTLAQREHVTPFIYQNPIRFKLGNVRYGTNESRQRWTVDTNEDFELISKIITLLYPTNKNFTIEDILKLIKNNPDLEKVNSHIEQKEMEK
ncbi:cytidylyltransferase domain-containing protein [Halalkalibacter okhensis]|uniref:Acylneuraminate cytidylyltransferase n=1 Tax=Halalkalibacter okhensis TaxID=333138 RepID=A0A0B0IIN4_9BACI|nr:glycosyltransferase family protein [Halalkalibacter okhensis]KHF39884.1 acylneuraminate cytidylyltransferase [Halalkalibacter okhensis]